LGEDSLLIKEVERTREAVEQEIHIVSLSDLERVLIQMALDYKRQISVLREYGVLNEGTHSYISDYDGLNGNEYEIPTYEQILEWLTPEQIEEYCAMQKEGLCPRLQCTPIGYKIDTLIRKIESYAPLDNMRKTIDPFVYGRGILEADEESFLYDPHYYKYMSNPLVLSPVGSQSKFDLIIKNRGWLVDIVATVQDLKEIEEEGVVGCRMSATYNKMKKKGRCGLSYESYLIAQMRAMKELKPLDVGVDGESRFTLLPNSDHSSSRIPNLADDSDICWPHTSVGAFESGEQGNRLLISSLSTFDEPDGVLTCRSAVRVELPDEEVDRNIDRYYEEVDCKH